MKSYLIPLNGPGRYFGEVPKSVNMITQYTSEIVMQYREIQDVSIKTGLF